MHVSDLLRLGRLSIRNGVLVGVCTVPNLGPDTRYVFRIIDIIKIGGSRSRLCLLAPLCTVSTIGMGRQPKPAGGFCCKPGGAGLNCHALPGHLRSDSTGLGSL